MSEWVWNEAKHEKEKGKKKKSTFLIDIGCLRKRFEQTKCCFQGYADF